MADELRKRLGSSFQISELVVLYAEGTDWADAIAARAGAGSETATAVDAAFGRYSREAADFSGGRPHFRERR